MLKRNCVMTPRQLLGAFAVLGAGSMAVSVAWALSGAWLVIPFLLIELTALAVAFFVYSRHVNDGEKITLDEAKVRVDVTEGIKTKTLELPRQWLRCARDDGHPRTTNRPHRISPRPTIAPDDLGPAATCSPSPSSC